MTLRITLEIVPHGIEADKRTIYQFDVSNAGSKTKAGKTRYVYKITTPDLPPWEWDTGKLVHMRELGAVSLSRKVLQRLEPATGYLGS